MEQQWKNLTAHGIVWKKQSVTNSSAGGLAIHLKATCWVSRRKRNPKKQSSWDGQTFTDRKNISSLLWSPNSSSQPCSLCPTWYWKHPFHLHCCYPHSILSSLTEPCSNQELQAQSCLLSVSCSACLLSLRAAIISHPLPLLSFCTPPLSLGPDCISWGLISHLLGREQFPTLTSALKQTTS